MLEVKLARPTILTQANRSPTSTSSLADGACDLGRCIVLRLVHAQLPTICTRVCCNTSDSSRLLETSRWLHCKSSSIARTSSAWL